MDPNQKKRREKRDVGKNKKEGATMAYKFDMVLKGGTVVDFATDREELLDVGIRDGQIAEIAPEINAACAREALDVSG